MAKTKQDWCGCPIRFGMGIFGDKWTLLIIRDLMFKGKQFYSEFTDPEEGISTNILADRLEKLQDNGIVQKQPDPENGTRYVYSLTKKGQDLMPIMFAIIDWSQKYDDKTEVPGPFIRDLRRDPQSLMARVRAGETVGA